MALRLMRRWSNLLGRLELGFTITSSNASSSIQHQAFQAGLPSAPGHQRVLLGPLRQLQRHVFSAHKPLLNQTPALYHHFQTAGLATLSAASKGSPKLGLSSLVLLAPCGITLFLGVWQLQRREQKMAMLEERQQKLAASPVSLQELLASKAQHTADLEFRRVEVTGAYDTSRSMFVGPRVKAAPGGMTEKGYHVVTPLQPEDKRSPPVLVNRGWVPNNWTEEETERQRVTVCGVVRGSDQPSQFVPSNVPEERQWFYIDAPLMAEACGIGERALLIEATSDVGSKPRAKHFPEPRDPLELARFKIMPQDHLNYAMTWLTLFVAVSTMAYIRLFGKSSRRKQVVLKYKDQT